MQELSSSTKLTHSPEPSAALSNEQAMSCICLDQADLQVGSEAENSWDEYVRNSPSGGPFHELTWMRAVRDVYGHRSQYFLARNAEQKTVGVLPMFEVRGPLTGKALISVPYGVTGGAVADTPQVEATLLTAAKSLAIEKQMEYCELRGNAEDQDFDTRSHYLIFRKSLPKQSSELLSWLPRKARAAVRNAINKHGLTVQYGHELLDVFYKLYVLSLRRLASPPHSKRFFEHLIRGYGDRLIVQVVYHGKTPAMGVISFRYRNELQPYWAGIDSEFNRMNVSNLAYFKLMELAVEQGIEVFDFGRTRKDNEGGCSFKINQGFEPTDLTYSYYSPIGKPAPDLRPSNRKFAAAQAVWRRLPLGVVQALGYRATKWLP